MRKPHGWIKWFVAYMAIAGGNYMLYSTVLPLRIFHHIIVSVILIYWLLKYGLPSTPLVGSFVIMAGSVLLSALASDDKRMALEFAWHWLINGALMLMCVEWFRQHRQRELFTAQFAAAGFIVGTCLLEWLVFGGRPGGAFFNINLAGGYLAALAVPVWAATKGNKPGMHKGLLWALLIGIGAVLILNQSRGAILAATVAAAVYMVLQSHRFKRVLMALGVLGLAGGVIYILSTLSMHSAGDVVRGDLWRVALSLIDSKALGVGPGLFGQAYQTLGQSGEWRFTGAHNLYLNLGAELGGLGLASGAVSLLTFLYAVSFRKRTPQQDASIAALVGIAVHCAVDNFPSQGYAFLVSLLIAHAAYEWQPSFSLKPLRWAASGAVLVGALYLLNFDRAQWAYERSLSNGSYSAAQEAALIDPYNRLYQINLSRIAHDGDLTAAEAITPGLANSASSLMIYGLINYGRVFQ